MRRVELLGEPAINNTRKSRSQASCLRPASAHSGARLATARNSSPQLSHPSEGNFQSLAAGGDFLASCLFVARGMPGTGDLNQRRTACP